MKITTEQLNSWHLFYGDFVRIASVGTNPDGETFVVFHSWDSESQTFQSQNLRADLFFRDTILMSSEDVLIHINRGLE